VHVSDSEKGDGYWTNVAPAKGLRATRLEVPSPTGGVERRFLHVIAVSSAAAPRMPVVAVRGDAVEGAALDGEAYIFLHTAVQSSPTGFDYTAPEDAHRHIVAGLAPSAGYVVSTARAEGGCKVTLTPGNTGTRTTDSGILVLSIAGCAPK